ncbi:MAG TPA: winged helix-turn-helix domain-containing protein [Thermoanaerobaculia bacterium]|nr:winged helix-turn-helix domain-containing protein [Thermoanaerobaculia bacterium]
MNSARHFYEFAAFRLEPAERRLLRGGEPVALTPKCFDLLVVLVENSGRLLEKSELLARVWPGQFVEEGSLSFNISELRRVLHEGENGLHYIETVRKKGFRFVAPVQAIPVADDGEAEEKPVATHTASRASWAFKIFFAIVAVAALASLAYILRPRSGGPPVEEPPRTMAVLPFKPLAADVRDEPLEMGICHALIIRLATVEQLVVRPTSSVVAYNKMGQDPLAAGRELRVDAVLDGYIQRSGDRIRVTARLLRTADGRSLWSGQFNENFTDIFAVEDSIAQKIVEALHLNLTRDEQRSVTKHPTENIEAYSLYLKGRYFQDKRTEEGVAKSVEYFQEATVKDPRYALAFAALSDSYELLAVRAGARPKVAYEKARAAAVRALEIDETTAEAHIALGQVKSWYDWDWPGAEREFKRAIELSANDPIPNQQYASYLLTMGRHQEAISEITRAQRLAPVSLTTNVQAARILYFAGQYEASMEQCRKTIEMDPGFGGAYIFVGRIDTQKGLYREALEALDHARILLHNSPEILSLIGYTYAVSGRTAEARQMLEELHRSSRQRYISPYHIAMIHAGLGERDEAFQWLEKAYDDREGRLTILRFAPEFAPLRSDPRFTKLLQRMNLVNSNAAPAGRRQ